MGKEDILAVTGALSNIAEVCLEQIAGREFEKLVVKFGRPLVAEGPRRGEPCELVILALGKLGGREMNYHSDLDLVFLYEADGHTAPVHPSMRCQTTSNQHFFSELAQRIIRAAGRLSAYGRLYEVDARLRPTGKSGVLATSLEEFRRYFCDGAAQLWERQAMCKARVVYGSPRVARLASQVVAQAAFELGWQPAFACEIRHMRHRLEETAGEANLKRGPGGIVDIEFLVQMLQLKFGWHNPRVRSSNTLVALEALAQHGALAQEDAHFFSRSYRFLRTIEGRLRLINSTARDKLPDDPTELAKLAHLVRFPSGEALRLEFDETTRQTRKRFDRLFDAEMP